MEGFARLIHTPLGYDPHNTVSVGIPLHKNAFTTWAGRAAYFEQLRAKVAETPGVIMTAISTNATPPRNGSNTRFEILGKPAIDQQTGSISFVDPGYFPALRIPILQGRLWNESENKIAAHVAIVNQTMARLYFPDGKAIGRSLKVPGIEDRPPDVLSAPGIADAWLAIVGIVGDARNDGLRNPVKPAIYIPYTLSMAGGTQILVRADVLPLTLMHAVARQVSSVNPEQQIYNNVESLDAWIADEPEWQQDHLVSWIFGFFLRCWACLWLP